MIVHSSLDDLFTDSEESDREDDGRNNGWGEGDDYGVYMECTEEEDRFRYMPLRKTETQKDAAFLGDHQKQRSDVPGTGMPISHGSFMCDDEDHGYELGTTTAGFVLVDANRVILGSDKEKGWPSGKNKMSTVKTFQLRTLPIGCTRAGDEDDVDKMIVALTEFVDSGGTDIKQMAWHVFDFARANMALNHRGQLLIGGFTQGFLTPYLYFISKDGVLDLTAKRSIPELQNRYQTGSGRGAAFVILNRWYNASMTEIQGKQLIVDCIQNAINNDAQTGKGIEYIVVSPNNAVKTTMEE